MGEKDIQTNVTKPDTRECANCGRFQSGGAGCGNHAGTCMRAGNAYYHWIPKPVADKDMENRIRKALELAWDYSQVDGDHHKTWAIDQMVKALCGSEEEYRKWVEEYEKPISIDSDDYYPWNTGIAP